MQNRCLKTSSRRRFSSDFLLAVVDVAVAVVVVVVVVVIVVVVGLLLFLTRVGSCLRNVCLVVLLPLVSSGRLLCLRWTGC